jgi:hypothetical protein
MSDNSSTNVSPTSPAADSGSAGATPSQSGQSVSVAKSQIVAFLALVHGACFFLPWIKLFGLVNLSGLQFAKEGNAALLLWFWPILSAVTLGAAVTGKNYQVGQMAGAVPFAVLGYAIVKEQNLRFVEGIAAGGWIGLACGLLLLVIARR